MMKTSKGKSVGTKDFGARDFGGRLDTAAKAKTAALEKYRERTAGGQPSDVAGEPAKKDPRR